MVMKSLDETHEFVEGVNSNVYWHGCAGKILTLNMIQLVGYYARQCFCFLNPTFDRVDARHFVNVFLLAVNSR
jgi:hypothetical protein